MTPLSIIELIFSILILVGFVFVFFWIKSKIKTSSKESLDMSNIENFETSKQRIKEEIVKKTVLEKIKELNKLFLLSLIFLLTYCTGGRELILFPAPPVRPSIEFIEKDGAALINEKDMNKILIYEKESDEYRTNLMEFLKKLQKDLK